MEGEDFSAWLSGIVRLSVGQRRQALAALANREGHSDGSELRSESESSPDSPADRSSRRRRPDALGTSGHERVDAQGCPHRAGREVIAWGGSSGLSRFGCKSCGRTFNALTKTPMARLRKKDRWLDQARAMIEGKSLCEGSRALRRSPDDGLSLASPVSRFSRGGQAESAERNRRGRRDVHPRILQRPVVRSAAQSAQARRIGQASGTLSGQHSCSRRPRPEGRDFRCDPGSG